MKRMTILTGFGLTLMYCMLQLLFADAPQVTLRDCLLSDKEAVVTLENLGRDDLKRVSVKVKVFAADRLVCSSTLVEKRQLAGNGRTRIRLPLDKALSRGADYRVIAWVQSGTARPVSREFSGRILKQSASAWTPGRPFVAIPEPTELRNSIRPIDVKMSMGLL